MTIDTELGDNLSGKLGKLVHEYCAKKNTNISLQHLLKAGGDGQQSLSDFAALLRSEIPIRLARRIQDLNEVPGMRDMEAVQDVKGIYVRSFLEMVESPPIVSEDDEENFATMLKGLYTKHSSVLVQIAKGAYEFRKTELAGDPDRLSIQRLEETQKFLDRFNISRIGLRVLAGQYLALREGPREDHIGMVCLKTSPSEMIHSAGETVQTICFDKYGRAPQVEISGRLDLTFPYIPTYLHYILLELLKNAMRATVEHHADVAELPPVTVIVADGKDNEDIVIKVADEGGGIARSRMKKVWSYLFTTADASLQESLFSGQDHSAISPIAGMGYGLPISRAYCRFFGGDIDVMSMEGHGTDVFVYLKRINTTNDPALVRQEPDFI